LPLPITGAALTGVVLGSYLVYFPLTILICLILAAVGLTIGERSGTWTAAQGTVLYGALLGGVLLWAAAGGGPAAELAALEHRGPVPVTGTIVEPPRHAPDRTVLVLQVTRVGEGTGGRAVAGRLRLTWREPDRNFLPGDEVGFTARVYPPSGTRNPGGFDYGAYLADQGIDAVSSVSGPGRVVRTATPPRVSQWTAWRVIEQWRNRVREAALASLSPPAQGIFLGIIIGEQGYLTDEVRDAFMATGTVHILSISGSHLGLVALLSFLFVKGGCRLLPVAWLLALSRIITPTRLATVATTVLVTFYTLLAGAEVATVRSLVMITIVMLAVWLGRTHDLLRAVAATALLLVVQNPRALYDISFQLSFMAVTAIALVIGLRRGEDFGGLPPRDRSVWDVAGERLRDYLWLTGGVTLATLPLVAYHFKQIAWLGLFANALVVPLAGCVLVPLGLGSAVWLLMTGRESLPAASWQQSLAESMSDLVGLFARLPGAEWHVASPAFLAMAAFYLLLAGAAWPAAEGRAPWRRRGCLIGVVLVLAWWGWSPRDAPGPDAVRVTFLDVGQGDACVLELPDGQTVLIDAGARYDTLDMGRSVVGPYLWERGIARLDHVVATHPQLDHVGGLAWVLRSFDVGRYWSNGVAREEPFYRRLQETLRARGLVEERAEEGRAIIGTGPCRLDVLNPPRALPMVGAQRASSGSVLNNLSIVTRLQCGTQTFLLTADAEAGALARLHQGEADLRATVLKVPHHGAASSLYRPLIEQARGGTAVISAGRHNAYGHPAPEVVSAYREAGIHLLRTDHDGAVWVTARLSRPGFHIESARESVLAPVPVDNMLGPGEGENYVRLFGKRAIWPMS
jgi:competence protein ComEC